MFKLTVDVGVIYFLVVYQHIAVFRHELPCLSCECVDKEDRFSFNFNADGVVG